MEEEKAAAYYDELTRKGSGAARFKQGLGFSSSNSNDTVPSKGSALPSASSFLSSFVRASSPSKTAELDKQAQLQSIQNKLSKKPKQNQHTDSSSSISRVSRDRDSDRSRDKLRTSRRRSRSHDRNSSRRSRSRSRDRHSRRRRSRSRSRSRSRDDYSRSRDSRERRSRKESELGKGKKRSESPPRGRDREAEKRGEGGKKEKKEKNRGVDYAKMIEGYDKMTPAERVKAKTKLQLSETAEKDPTKGVGSKWERFDFDKDAPLDDEEIEAAEDDTALVKHIGQSFRFSLVEAKREEKLKVAHDEAMFGAPSLPPASETDEEEIEDSKKEPNDSAPVASLISDQVLSLQRGSWRDRVRKT